MSARRSHTLLTATQIAQRFLAGINSHDVGAMIANAPRLAAAIARACILAVSSQPTTTSLI
jgi:hypothetical protein